MAPRASLEKASENLLLWVFLFLARAEGVVRGKQGLSIRGGSVKPFAAELEGGASTDGAAIEGLPRTAPWSGNIRR